jgi:hypothetical protein
MVFADYKPFVEIAQGWLGDFFMEWCNRFEVEGVTQKRTRLVWRWAEFLPQSHLRCLGSDGLARPGANPVDPVDSNPGYIS